MQDICGLHPKGCDHEGASTWAAGRPYSGIVIGESRYQNPVALKRKCILVFHDNHTIMLLLEVLLLFIAYRKSHQVLKYTGKSVWCYWRTLCNFRKVHGKIVQTQKATTFWVILMNIEAFLCSTVPLNSIVPPFCELEDKGVIFIKISYKKWLNFWLCIVSVDCTQLVKSGRNRLKALGTIGSMQTHLSAVSSTPVLYYLWACKLQGFSCQSQRLCFLILAKIYSYTSERSVKTFLLLDCSNCSPPEVSQSLPSYYL